MSVNHFPVTWFQLLFSTVWLSFAEIFPLGVSFHEWARTTFLGWASFSLSQQAFLKFGLGVGLLISFRHDWASLLSRGLQVVLFRKTPQSLDERLSFLLLCTCFPLLVMRGFFSDFWISLEFWSWQTQSFLFLGFGAGLWLLESLWNRQSRGWLDWKFLDTCFLGSCLLLAPVPGTDPVTLLLLGGMLLHHQRRSGIQFALFCLLPLLFGEAFQLLRDSGEGSFFSREALPSWVIFWTACLSSLLGVQVLLYRTPENLFRTLFISRLLGVGAIWSWFSFFS